MYIEITSVHPKAIRFDQAGDWSYWENHRIHALVRDDLDESSQLAIGIHEIVEAYLCREAGITDKAVCEFDRQYEEERKQGKHNEEEEPGDDPRSPYREEHMAATHVERAVCHALGINWKDHCQSVIGL